MLRRAIILLSALPLVPVLLPAADGQSSVESELLGLINGGRSSHLTVHSGLRAVGRVHSEEMSQAGGLNHNGAAERIQQAPPDPTESNGAPDDGFTGTWCENVAYVRGAPESEVASRVYQGWTNSSSHNRCMNDGRMNVTGIGVYFDGETYWATLESSVDRTVPGSAPPPTPAPTPTPTPEITPRLRTEPPERTAPPERTEPPQPTDRPEPTDRTAQPILQVGPSASPVAQTIGSVAGTAERFIASPALPAAEQNTLTWVGFAGALAALALLAEAWRRLNRRQAEDGSG